MQTATGRKGKCLSRYSLLACKSVQSAHQATHHSDVVCMVRYYLRFERAGRLRINRTHIFQLKTPLHENGRNKSRQNLMKHPLVATVDRHTNTESHRSPDQLLGENGSERLFFVLRSGSMHLNH